MTTAIENQIERFAPGFRDLVIARATHDTTAMERHNANLVGGDIGGGYSGLTQFVRRPVLSPHPWRTPLPGVYLCSASTPPGAGVHGMGGYHAARLALADQAKREPVRKTLTLGLDFDLDFDRQNIRSMSEGRRGD
jgi:phytoene dehydrogenase-like protein